jgi:hypothetical protein
VEARPAGAGGRGRAGCPALVTGGQAGLQPVVSSSPERQRGLLQSPAFELSLHCIESSPRTMRVPHPCPQWVIHTADLWKSSLSDWSSLIAGPAQPSCVPGCSQSLHHPGTLDSHQMPAGGRGRGAFFGRPSLLRWSAALPFSPQRPARSFSGPVKSRHAGVRLPSSCKANPG